MQSISGVLPGMAQPPVTAAGVNEAPKVQRPENEPQERLREPVMDEYVPEEKREPSGRYWLGRDEDGTPKIYFDAPERDEKPDGEAESCTCSTDKVDREIEQMKTKQAELERQLDTETDSTRISEVERKLAQIERALSQKDNDTYRRRHAVFS